MPQLIFHQDIALKGPLRINTREHLHQSRFPCTVLTDERVKFTLIERKTYAVQRLDARKLLDDRTHFQQWFSVPERFHISANKLPDSRTHKRFFHLRVLHKPSPDISASQIF